MILHFTKDQGRPPERRDVGNVLQAKPVRNGEHPTEKPVELLEKLISVVCPPRGVVLDPFMGSGSAGVAAVNSGRCFIGVEREEHYVGISARKIEAAEALIAAELIGE